MKEVIIITGGGTLGHVLPIIPIIKELQKEYIFIYIGTKKGIEKQYLLDNELNDLFQDLYFLDMDGVNRKHLLKNIIVFLKYLGLRKRIKQIYKEYKPVLVIGMGGYISGVAIHIAQMKKIKTIIHEQNSVLGLANKLVYKKANKLLLSFPIDSLKGNNIKIIGNPRYTEVLLNYMSKDNYNNLLIIGGSLGSKKINEIILNNIEKLKDIKITLITGNKYYNENIIKIQNLMTIYPNLMIYPFVNELVSMMSQASIIISRSGATTINEIMALRKCSILIPSPNVTENHQLKNALYLKDHNACLMIEEKDLNIDVLLKNIFLLYNNYNYKKEMENNIKKIITNNPKEDFIKAIREII